MGCTNNRAEGTTRTTIPIEQATDNTELGDIYKAIKKNPSQYFLERNVKSCFKKGQMDKAISNITETT